MRHSVEIDKVREAGLCERCLCFDPQQVHGVRKFCNSTQKPNEAYECTNSAARLAYLTGRIDTRHSRDGGQS